LLAKGEADPPQSPLGKGGSKTGQVTLSLLALLLAKGESADPPQSPLGKGGSKTGQGTLSLLALLLAKGGSAAPPQSPPGKGGSKTGLARLSLLALPLTKGELEGVLEPTTPIFQDRHQERRGSIEPLGRPPRWLRWFWPRPFFWRPAAATPSEPRR